MAIIIGIGGASRAGKSTLAKKLKETFASKNVLHIDLDDFVKPVKDLPVVRDQIDWEQPESYDIAQVVETIETQQSAYDFILLEGILALHFEDLLVRYHLQLFIEISKETFLFRRMQETRWGNEPDWYIQHVWECFEQYGNHHSSAFCLSGEIEISDMAMKDIVKRAEQLLG